MKNDDYYKIITETLQSYLSKLPLEDINYLKNGGGIKRLLKKLKRRAWLKKLMKVKYP